MTILHRRVFWFTLLAVLFLLFNPAPALAQQMEAGADFLIGVPQKEFADNVDTTGYGVSGQFAYFLGESPIAVGAEVGYLNYGTVERLEPFSPDIPEIIVRVSTTNNILLTHGFIRVQPRSGPVRPYFDGLIGFKYLFTRSSIRDDSFPGETLASTTNFDDLAFSYGIGGGMKITVWEGTSGRRGQAPAELSIHLGARYLWGAEARYMKKGSIRQAPNGDIIFDVFESETDMLTPQIGIRFNF